MPVHFHPSFYRSAAVCSVLSAVTTLGLWLWRAAVEDAALSGAAADRS